MSDSAPLAPFLPPPPPLIQCVPNFSEGRDPGVLRRLLDAASGIRSVVCADFSADPDHHRSVLTLLGRPEGLQGAARALARTAVECIDLSRHAGAHPRLGALDVLPFVPYGATTMETCVDLARRVGAELAEALDLPVYLYGAAALRPDRAALPGIRNRGFEALRGVPLHGDLEPDFGPPRLHSTAGAVCVGARGPLLAFNVQLDTDDVAAARRVAAAVREAGGGLPGVRALGLRLASRPGTQLSMNVTLPDETPLHLVLEQVCEAAAREGAAVTSTELVGALRVADLLAVCRSALGAPDLRREQVLELWERALVE